MLDSVSSMTVRSWMYVRISKAPAGFDLHDVLEGAFADDGVRADPEGGSVVGHSLVQDVLQVGRGACDASMRVGAPRKEEYGVWVTATRSLPADSRKYTRRRQ